MFCINCFYKDTRVTNSRPHKKQPTVWRRRTCPECGFTFTTYEECALDEVLLVESGKKRVPYSRGKLLASIINSLTPVGESVDDAYWLLQTVEQKLLAHQRDFPSWQPVTTNLLAGICHETLDAYSNAAGMGYGAAHGLVARTQKRRPGRPRSA